MEYIFGVILFIILLLVGIKVENEETAKAAWDSSGVKAEVAIMLIVMSIVGITMMLVLAYYEVVA